jgi:hypothetical protein
MRLRLPGTAVYWPPSGADVYGQNTLGSPIQLPCRWEKKITETIDSTGTIVLSGSTVYLASEVLVGGRLFEGLLKTVQASGFVITDRRVREIINVGVVPNLKGTQTLTTAMLR